MNMIPRNKSRQAQWIKNAGLDITKLNKESFICEYHSTADMWEEARADGKKKLKRTAVPTIFGDLVTQVKYPKETNKSLVPSSSQEPTKQIITIHDSSSDKIIIEEYNESIHSNDSGIKTTTEDIDVPIPSNEDQNSNDIATNKTLSLNG